jgi:hypothetical protein
MKHNDKPLSVNQEVEIIEFGKIVHGVIHKINNTGMSTSRPIKVKVRSDWTKSGYKIIAKKAIHVYPRGEAII